MNTEWRELKTIDDFREIKSINEGFVVITDNATRNKVHKPSCVYVKEDNFIKKVVMNHNFSGCYYWIGDVEADGWNAAHCGKCW